MGGADVLIKDIETLSEARAKAQDALSRARLATDPDAQRQWEEVAAEWNMQIAELDGGEGLPPRHPSAGRRFCSAR
jgi:hypothetical protein